MRIELYEPSWPGAVNDALSLAGVIVSEDTVEGWTKLEQALAYDWAIREHLRASDNPVRRRDKPSFVTAAQVAGS